MAKNPAVPSLEQIIGPIAPDESNLFEKHMEYRSIIARQRMKTEEFEGYEGGTEKIFDGVYTSAYSTAVKNKLKGKTDTGSLADSLELVVVEALKKLNFSAAKHAAGLHEARKLAKEFENDEERLQSLLGMAKQYLGAGDQDLGVLISGLKVGDPLLWNQAIRQFTDKLKDSVIDAYVSRHLTKTVGEGNHHKFAAYLVTHHLPQAYGVEPEKPLTEVAAGLGPILQKTAQLEGAYNPLALKQFGYKRIERPKETAGHK